jgi:hypothetical protein
MGQSRRFLAVFSAINGNLPHVPSIQLTQQAGEPTKSNDDSHQHAPADSGNRIRASIGRTKLCRPLDSLKAKDTIGQ